MPHACAQALEPKFYVRLVGPAIAVGSVRRSSDDGAFAVEFTAYR